MKNRIIIWDLEKKFNLQLKNVYLWNSYNENYYNKSIPSILEKNSDKYKNLFLSFIYDLSQTKINKTSLIDCLNIKKDFSFWWMNKVFEKNPLKSPRVYDCLKMLVLEELIDKKKYTELILYTADKKIENVISKLCSNAGLKFVLKKENKKGGKFSLLKLFYALPHALQGVIYYFYYIYKKIFLLNKNFNNLKLMNESIFICSYFVNFNYKKSASDNFISSFWNCLTLELLKINYKINWMHHLLINKKYKSSKNAYVILSDINKNSNNTELHNFVESFLDIKIIFKVFFLWLKCIFFSYKTKKIKKNFHLKFSKINFWPLLDDDWKSSLFGKDSIHSLFMLELFVKYFKNLPTQKIGIYLYENQPWEMAMLYSWKKYQKSPIIGFAHATVPYWHLYYYNHINFYNKLKNSFLPKPDYVAVNGQLALLNFNESGFPKNKIVSVEALRYLNSFTNISRSDVLQSNKKILVLGEMQKNSMEYMLQILNDANNFLKKNKYEISIKFHPSNILTFNNQLNQTIKEETLPLENILHNFDIVISGNSTSASLEAYLLKKKVIVILSGSFLNLSPLRKNPEVDFISSVEDLKRALNNYNGLINRDINLDKYLYLDNKIPKWLSLINNKCLS